MSSYLKRNKWKLAIAIIFIAVAGVFIRGMAIQMSEVAEGNSFLNNLEARARNHHLSNEQYNAVYQFELQQVHDPGLALNATDRYLDSMQQRPH